MKNCIIINLLMYKKEVELNSKYVELEIDKIELDFDNPRISLYIENKQKSDLTSEDLEFALKGPSGELGTGALKESIRTNEGIIHPIIVNYKSDKEKYTVIEGNTRVQIYRELYKSSKDIKWTKIRAMVYEDLSEEKIHAIRLQSHLVGPRDWDPYSKAKYLNYLSTEERLPISQLVSFCGGNKNKVQKMIDAYNVMETFYRPIVDADSEFDVTRYSAFEELQNKQTWEALAKHGYKEEDFAQWVKDGKLEPIRYVRELGNILNNAKSKEIFLKDGAKVAYEVLTAENVISNNTPLNSLSNYDLAKELTKRLRAIEHREILYLKNDFDYEDRKELLLSLYDELDFVIRQINEE